MPKEFHCELTGIVANSHLTSGICQCTDLNTTVVLDHATDPTDISGILPLGRALRGKCRYVSPKFGSTYIGHPNVPPGAWCTGFHVHVHYGSLTFGGPTSLIVEVWSDYGGVEAIGHVALPVDQHGLAACFAVPDPSDLNIPLVVPLANARDPILPWDNMRCDYSAATAKLTFVPY